MVKKSVLDRFVKLGGYNIVKLKKGKWKNISLASKRTGISRPTIYEILKKHPEAPSKVMPKYVEEFKETEGYRQIEKEYGKKGWFKGHKKVIREGWLFLNKKDPITWTKDDFTKLWDKWHDPKLGTIRGEKGLEFRRLMNLLPEGTKLRAKFKTKQAKPTRTKWYLREEEIIRMIHLIERVDVLIFFILGILTGARKKAILTPIPSEIDFVKGTLSMYESKIKTWVTKYLPNSAMTLIERYIKDFNIKPNQRLMPMDENTYYERIKAVGKKAEIIKMVGVPPKPQGVSPHMLKHTFVQQCKEHGVPAEVATQQAHTELRTLEKWYSFAKEENIRKHMRGEQWKPEPFNIFADRIVGHATIRYGQIS